MAILHVHMLPDLAVTESLAGATAVVVDVLRATTTILHALAAGAQEIIPCLEVEEALKIAANLAPDQRVLGGERGGLRVEGFQLGNSPSEYSRATVEGRTVVFTTTNGTRAMMCCRQARRVLIGALVNLTALAERLEAEENVQVVCAGTRGAISRDDVLAAGALVTLLRLREPAQFELNDQALLAADAWRAAIAGEPLHPGEPAHRPRLVEILQECQGGRDLVELGLTADIQAAAQIDHLPLVPELDLARWSIRLP